MDDWASTTLSGTIIGSLVIALIFIFKTAFSRDPARATADVEQITSGVRDLEILSYATSSGSSASVTQSKK